MGTHLTLVVCGLPTSPDSTESSQPTSSAWMIVVGAWFSALEHPSQNAPSREPEPSRPLGERCSYGSARSALDEGCKSPLVTYIVGAAEMAVI